MSHEKAFCNDFERLATALADESAAIDAIPEAIDGGGGSIGDPGTKPVTTHSWSMAGEPPGIAFLGWLLYYPDGNPGWTTDVEDASTREGVVDVVPAWSVDSTGGDFDSDVADTEVFAAWAVALAQGNAMNAIITACNEWMDGAESVIAEATAGASVDNSDVRAAVAVLRLRLTVAQAAWAETMRKWQFSAGRNK